MTLSDNICVAHIKRNQQNEIVAIQTNEEHSICVAERARMFAEEFGMGEWGYVLGLLHDKGKEGEEFQEYIRDVNGIPGHKGWTQKGKAHAYVGAIIAHQLYGATSEPILCNPIASHHRGLYDYFELESVLENNNPPCRDTDIKKMNLKRPKFKISAEEIHHLSRCLFSCLIDADYLDTERFMNEASFYARNNDKTLKELLPVLENHLKSLSEGAEDSKVNRVRKDVQKECRLAASGDRGFYSLTVPTGGGKTLASILWAMKHAVHNGQKRIIIAIPYTSIIVQTAAVLKSIFGEENVLEQHSVFDFESIENKDNRLRAKLATENWDYPIVVTTNVQLFESMFSSKPSDCRKLHNLVNSVIILDEVQVLPTDFLQPIIDALKAYKNMFGISVLFTTASQPVLSGIIEGCNPRASFSGIENIKEIIPKEYALHKKLRRVELQIDNSGSTYTEIADRLSTHDVVLCIVNTRKDAREVFERLPKEGLTIHLSRMMCPRHVSQRIESIKRALSDNSEKVIRVVATQLIEAGVDIDFPVVYRQEAGLDSILQAAGRCNREGKKAMATTYVFSLRNEHNLYGSIVDANNARLNILHVNDWFAPETMIEYFKQLYCRKETFDKKGMKELLYKPNEICFEQASQEFRLIEETGKTVVVNMEDSLELVEKLKIEGMSYPLMRRLSQYSVNIHERDFLELKSYGAIDEVCEGIYVVNDRAQYDNDIGLRLGNHWMEEILIK